RGGEQALGVGAVKLAELLWVLLREAPPALRAQEQVHGDRRERVVAQQEVGVLEFLRPADLAREQEVRRHRAQRLVVGQRQSGLVDHLYQRDRPRRLAGLVLRMHRQPHLLAGYVALLVRLYRYVEAMRRVAEDQPLRDRDESRDGRARVIFEDGD